jgi:hypothetical protein
MHNIDDTSIFPNSTYLSAGIIHPAVGKIERTAGRKVTSRFGPVKSWTVDYSKKDPDIVVVTSLATYTLLKPSIEYRPLFSDLVEQAAICSAIVTTLKSARRDALEDMSFDAVLAAMGRARAVTGYRSIRDAVSLNRSFILGQISPMQAALGNSFALHESAFIEHLRLKVIFPTREHIRLSILLM